MQRTLRIFLAFITAACLVGVDGAGARTSGPTTAEAVADAYGSTAESGELTPRVQVRSPWGKDDTVGDTARPQGDLRRIIVENGRVQMKFTFRTVAIPRWDTAMTDRTTGMVFDMDWHGTTVPPNRTIVVTRDDGQWVIVIFNGSGQGICSRTGGVRQLTNNRFQFTAPVELCLGGPHVVRVQTGFVDDLDDTAVEDTRVDYAPNGRAYGPFVRLPGSSRSSAESATTGGWTVH